MRKRALAASFVIAIVCAAAALLRGTGTSSVTLGGLEYRSLIVDGSTTCTAGVPPPVCYSAAFVNPRNIALGRIVDTSSTLAGDEQFYAWDAPH